MKIPKKIRLMGREIDIEITNTLPSEGGEDCMGIADFNDSKIRISGVSPTGKKLTKNFKEEILLHECVHYILYFLGQNEREGNEQLVDGISCLLHELIPQIEGTN
jgi:hypothetical protein